MIYLGIDPGKTGAICRINSGSLADWVIDCPIDGAAIAKQLWDYRPQGPLPGRVIIEKAQAMPKQGVVSMFNYGVSYGIYLGILHSLGIPYVEVRPQTWKVEFRLIGKSKEASIVEARHLFPALQQEVCLRKHHGRAESLLIAEFGRRKGL